jgi:hypothetical protein
MGSTTAIKHSVSGDSALWPIILQAFVGALIVGEQL